jgi:hypothetical protein
MFEHILKDMQGDHSLETPGEDPRVSFSKAFHTIISTLRLKPTPVYRAAVADLN